MFKKENTSEINFMEHFKEIMEHSAEILIGKNLLSLGIMKQIKELVKKRSMIKIKILKSALDTSSKEEIIANIIHQTRFYLLDTRGNSFILAKKPLKGLKVSLKCKKITELSKTMFSDDNNLKND